jgi:anaerobic selenocysteine-containing dehydrogenase
VQVLLVDGANPVFASPSSWRAREALLKVPFIASFGNFIDETSVLSDLILPDHAFLESWVEGRPESGAAVPVATLAPPALRPLHQTRATPDVLLQVASRLGKPLDFPWQTFDEMLMAAFATLPAPSADTDAWTAAQQQGGWWGRADSPGQTLQGGPAGQAERSSRGTQGGTNQAGRTDAAPARALEARFDGDPGAYPFHFLPYASHAFLDGSLAHLPWLQELPDAMTTAMWSSWAEINPQTASKLGIAEGDVLEIASTQGSLRTPALLSPGIAPDVIAMPVGQGHETFTRYASGRGQNPIKILAAAAEPETGALAWAATRVRVTRIGPPSGDLILFAGEMREHPHEHEHER